MSPRDNLNSTTAACAIVAAQLSETRDRTTALHAEAERLDARGAEMDSTATTPDELEAVAAIRREAEAKRREALLMQAKIPGLEREKGAAETAITNARLHVYRPDRDAAHGEVLAVMETLGAALARLLAADLALDAAVGTRFTFDPNEHPPADLWRPRPLIAQLVGAIPARLRPADFGETIARAAEAIARGEMQHVE